MEKLDVKLCYQILGLEPGVTVAQLKEKRGKLAQQWHPDKEKDPKRKAVLEDKMKDINNAFDFLKASLSGTPARPTQAKQQTQTDAPRPAPVKKKLWEVEAEERRKKTAEREAKERREQEAQQREWKAKFLRVQEEAARQRAQQQAEATRLREWFAQEKERQEQEATPRDRRTRFTQVRQEAEAIPPVRQEAEFISRPREPRPPARKELGDSKHIYLKGKCTKCGKSKEQIDGYGLACV